MRLKAEIWVHAFLRRSFVNGLYGAVLRKGAAEAGVVYVVVNRLDGTVRMLGPPPGSAIDEAGERLWSEVIPPVTSAAEVAPFVARLAKIDPDIWVVEVEDRAGTAGLTVLAPE
ncbi:MAG: DUF1491 family protein [Parvibaculaceae bacterium]